MGRRRLSPARVALFVGAATGLAVVLAFFALGSEFSRTLPGNPVPPASPIATGWDDRRPALWMVTAVEAGDGGLRGVLLRFDPDSGAVEATFALEVIPVAAAFDFASDRVFVLALGHQQGAPHEGVRGQLVAMNLAGETLAEAQTGIHPVAVAVDATTRRLFVLNRGVAPGLGTLGMYDADTLVALGEVNTGAYPNSLWLHSAPPRAVVANYVGHSVSLVNVDGQMSAQEISLGTQPGRTALARLDPSGRIAVVVNLSERSLEADRAPGRIDVLDLPNGSIRWSSEFPDPIDAWVSSSGAVVVVQRQGAAFMTTVLDGSAGALLYSIAGTGPEAIADRSGRLVLWRPAEDRVVILDIATGAELCQTTVSAGAEVRLLSAEVAPVAIVTFANRVVARPLGDHADDWARCPRSSRVY